MAKADEDLGTLDEVVDGGFDGLVQAVRRLARGMEEVERCGLSRRALVLLLADASNLGKRDVEKLIDTLGKLEERFLASDE